MANKKKGVIPDSMTIEEATEFWDTHSVADYSSHVVQKVRGVSIETLINLWIQEKITANG